MPELWQDDVTPEAIAGDIIPILTDPSVWKARHEAMELVQKEMGSPGAVTRVAALILRFIKENHTA